MLHSRPFVFVLILLLFAFLALADIPHQTTPYWAFCLNPDTASAAQADDNLRHVPNSNAAFTTVETQDLFNVPDWHPADHPIAGRSPSYIVRQLYDIQSGARSGTGSLQMRRQVAKLSIDDMIAIAAFVSSLNP